MNPPATLPGVASPCVGVCRLTDNGVCEGCLRTVDEISAWGSMDEADREVVISALATRRVQEQS